MKNSFMTIYKLMHSIHNFTSSARNHLVAFAQVAELVKLSNSKIMAATTFTDEYTYTIPPARLFKASVLDSHHLFPKLLPQAFKSIEILHGNGGAGSIKQINLGEGKTLNYLKYHIDELNEETYTYNYTLIEGDALSDKLEKITYEVKFEPTANGGTISKMTSKYYPKGDYVVNEEEVKAGKEKASGMYKAVEAFLLQNPEAYA